MKEDITLSKIGTGISKWLLLFPIAGIPLLYSRQLIDPVSLPQAFALGVYLIFLTAILFFSKEWRQNFSTRLFSNKILIFYCIYFIFAGISLFKSINMADGIFEWLRIGLFGIYALLLISYFQNDKNFKNNFIKFITVLSFIISIIGFLQLTNLKFLYQIGSYSSTFTNPNLFAEVLFLTFPVLLYGIYFFKTRFNYFCGITLAFCFISIILTLCRAVWLATFLSGFISFILFLSLEKKIDKQIIKKAFPYLAILTLLVCMSFAVIYKYSFYETVNVKKDAIVSSGTMDIRISLWDKTIQLIKEHFLLGIGQGSWKIAILQTGSVNLSTVGSNVFFQSPHNDFLAVWSENGSLALIAYILFFISAIYYSIQIIKKANAPEDRYWGYVCFFAVIGYIIFSSFSFSKDRIPQSIILMTMMSSIIVLYSKIDIPQTNNFKISWSIFFIPITAIVLLSCSIAAIKINSEYHLRLAYDARAQNNWGKVIKEIKKADLVFYRIDPVSTPIAWYSGSAYFNSGNIEQALVEFNKAYAVNPFHIHVLNNIGSCYSKLGKQEKAIEFYQKALRIDSHFDDALLNLSAIYFNTGHIDKAYTTIRKVSDELAHENYHEFLSAILKAKIKNLYDTTNEKDLKIALALLQNDDASLCAMFEQAKIKNIELIDQLKQAQPELYSNSKKS